MWCWHKWVIIKSDSYDQIKLNIKCKMDHENRTDKAKWPNLPMPPVPTLVSENGMPKQYVKKVCSKCGKRVDTYTPAMLKANREVREERIMIENLNRWFNDSQRNNRWE